MHFGLGDLASFAPRLRATVVRLSEEIQRTRREYLLSNNIIVLFCHNFLSDLRANPKAFALILLFILPLFSEAYGQTAPQTPDELPDSSVEIFNRLSPSRAINRDEVLVLARDKRIEGDWTYLVGLSELRSQGMVLRADEIDYNRETGYAEARGNVYYESFETKEKIWAVRVEYYTREEKGRFYEVRGETYPKVDSKPGLYRTDGAFRFEGKWADRDGEVYHLYDGTMTNCEEPTAWWTLRGPKFTIRPGVSATMQRSTLRIRSVPVFYAPWFYKSLKEGERKSGFLTPNFGNSNRRGQMFGGGYYWAIARNYDAMYRGQYFTTRGLAHQVDFRGKPTQNSDFNFDIYGIQDRGRAPENGERYKAPGYNMVAKGKTLLPGGFYAVGELNYLSSFRFRQEFSESIAEAIAPEVRSTGLVAKDWSTFHLTAAFTRMQMFRTNDADSISTRKLPELRFASRSRRLKKDIPLYVSFDNAWGLVRRNQPLFQTRQFVSRTDIAPRIFMPLEWKGFHIVPSYSPRVTAYDSSLAEVLDESTNTRMLNVVGQNVTRTSQDMAVEILPPSLSRIFDKKGFWGEKLKHVVEPRFVVRRVNGIDNFNDLIRFDETELLSNTAEAEMAVVNRFFGKRGHNVEELLSWEVRHKRYFDEDFGGAVVAGRRNVVDSSLDLGGFTFLNQPRRYSPVASTLRVSPVTRYAIQWRADYDPFYGQFLNSILTVDARYGDFLFIAGQNRVRSTPLLLEEEDRNVTLQRDIATSLLLSPPAHQITSTVAWRDSLKKGWSAAFNNWYDVRLQQIVTSTAQVTYNTDCCGFSVQYRSIGLRGENQFRFSLTIANIGAFGTLRKQERLF